MPLARTGGEPAWKIDGQAASLFVFAVTVAVNGKAVTPANISQAGEGLSFLYAGSSLLVGTGGRVKEKSPRGSGE